MFKKDGLFIDMNELDWYHDDLFEIVAVESFDWHKSIDGNPIINIECLESELLKELFEK